MKKRVIFIAVLTLLAIVSNAQVSNHDFVKGADVGFLTGQERQGQKFYDVRGTERECLELLKNDYQMSAIRMRVWVNPRGGSCDKNELLAMAKRVKELGMQLMVDFHYSDSWADPAKQPIPKAWLGHSFEEMKQDVRNHTVEVLSLLKENGITPRWVQVGNETTNGMLWDMGHIDKQPQQYAGFIRAGYDAVKEVFPEAIVIVHLDRGHRQDIYDKNLDIILKYGGKFDMIGMSLYPYWAMEGHPELKADDIITNCIKNIRYVSQKYGCDVMIVETGYEVNEQHPEIMEEGRRQLSRVIHETRTETGGHCRGVFYWEPQCRPGGYKLGAFNSKGQPTVIMDGFIEGKHKNIDNGGSGAYKAEAREEATFTDAVIYKPVDLKAAAKEGPLPVLVWANGGCNDTSLPHERMLNEVASQGYVVIALGSMQERIDDRPLKKSPNEQMAQAMDWITKEASRRESEYYGVVDVNKMAVAGQSCGGAQALIASSDPRVKTTVMVNSGMGDMQMSGASRESLRSLHAPILYMPGGEDDVAYGNAIKDFERIDHVFTAFANHLTAGHGGDFDQRYGGSFARMMTAWLNWQLKGRADCGDIFLKNKLDMFPEWTMRSKAVVKGFVNEPFVVKEVHCKNHKNQDIFGKLYLPQNGSGMKPIAILAHGYNSSFRETEAYAQTLAMNGIAAYIFDFCGGSVNSRSEGKTTEMSVFTEADDVKAIVEAVKTWDDVDPRRIALLGCSQGGLVAAIASSQMPKAFKAVVLVYPALMIAEHAVSVHPKEAIHSETGVDVMGMPLSHVYYDQLVGYKVFDEMKKYHGDVMIVYGDKDPIAAGDYMERARKVYRSCEVNVVPDGAHGFPQSITHVKANDYIVKFLRRKML